MSKKSKTPVAAAERRLTPMPVYSAGILLLVVAAGLSLVLALDSLPSFNMPGCGPDAGCAQVQNHPLAKVPGTDWPIAFAGLAYFVAACLVWIVTARKGLPKSALAVAALGGLASAFYLFAMFAIVKGFCIYCFGTHLANLAFVGLAFVATPRRPGQTGKVLALGGISFAAVAFAMTAVMVSDRDRVDAQNAANAEDSVRQILAQGGSSPATPAPGDTPSAGADEDAPTPVFEDLGMGVDAQGRTVRRKRTTADRLLGAVGDNASPGTQTGGGVRQPEANLLDDVLLPPRPLSDEGRPGFTGRYLIGPEKADVRIVMYSSYQCPDCYRIEQEVRRVLNLYDNVSFSLKQFPLNSDCNPYISTKPHPAGCEAARAAEAAGILGGPEAFWKMSFWLYDYLAGTRSPEQRDLYARAESLGLNLQEFIDTMRSEEVERRIVADIDEGRQLGLFMTPMIFINGVQFRGWQTRDQLIASVNFMLRSGQLTPQTAENDRPPNFDVKFVEDWQRAPVLRNVSRQDNFTRGASTDQKARLVLFGCYQRPASVEADAVARRLLEEFPGLAYEFRFYPMNNRCNSFVDSLLSVNGCTLAQAVAAAGILGGNEAHWKMHDAAFRIGADFSDEALDAAFVDAGIDPAQARELMASPEVAALIAGDGAAYKSTNALAVPQFFVDDKVVNQWKLDDHLIIRDIVESAINK